MEEIEILKQKNPERYKAISISSLLFFEDEDDVVGFVNKMDNHIKYLASTLVDGKVTLKYDCPKESQDIDSLCKALVEDIQEKNESSEMITSKLKSLATRTLEALKEAGVNYYKNKTEEKYIEHCLGYYDQLMLLKDISDLADEYSQ